MDRMLKLRMWSQNGVENWLGLAIRLTEKDDKLRFDKFKSQSVGKFVIQANRKLNKGPLSSW